MSPCEAAAEHGQDTPESLHAPPQTATHAMLSKGQAQLWASKRILKLTPFQYSFFRPRRRRSTAWHVRRRSVIWLWGPTSAGRTLCRRGTNPCLIPLPGPDPDLDPDDKWSLTLTPTLIVTLTDTDST